MYKVKLLVVALTTSDINRLKRCLYSIQHQIPVREAGIEIVPDIHVIVNTQNKTYASEVQQELGHEYPVTVTVSDGTPGTGKNSVFDYFRSLGKKYDYLFQVDGDDILYPTAFQELARFFAEHWDVVSFQSMDWLSTNRAENMNHIALKDNVWLHTWGDQQVNLREIAQFKYATDPDFGKTGERIFTPGTSMVLSGKFLRKYPHIRHTNQIKLFEDYYFYLHLFALHCKGEIKMCHINNSYIYMYDRTNENSVSTSNCFYGKLEISMIQGVLDKYQIWDKHPKVDLPFITRPPLDFADRRDRIHWVRFLLDKYPTQMKSLDLEKLKKDQMERMQAIAMTKNPLARIQTVGR